MSDERKYSSKDQYHFYKDMANTGRAPERTLKDGTVIPPKELTTVERVRASNKAEKHLANLNNFMKIANRVRSKEDTGGYTIAGKASDGSTVVIAEVTRNDYADKPKATKPKKTK